MAKAAAPGRFRAQVRQVWYATISSVLGFVFFQAFLGGFEVGGSNGGREMRCDVVMKQIEFELIPDRKGCSRDVGFIGDFGKNFAKFTDKTPSMSHQQEKV